MNNNDNIQATMSSLVPLTSVPAPLPAASSRAFSPAPFCPLLRGFAPSREIPRSASACRPPAPTAFHPLSSLFRLAAVATFAFAGFVGGATTDMSACGISWGLPETPVSISSLGNHSNRFEFWTDRLGSVKVAGVFTKEGKSLEIPLHIGFNPLSTYTSPLGYGFEFPIFDSRLVWVNARTVKMHLPDGNVEELSYNKTKSTLSGSNWLGRQDGAKNQTIMQASCGWTLTFAGNRLAALRSPEGVLLSITRKPDGVMQVSHGINSILKLEPLENGIARHYKLQFANGTRLLEMGKRPVASIGKNKTPETLWRPCLVAMETQERKKIKFEFKENSLSFDDEPVFSYQWDALTGFLTSENEKRYDTIVVKGMKCLRTTYPDGTTELSGSEAGGYISQMRGGDVVFTETGRHPVSGNVIPRRSFLLRGGEEVPHEQHWYDSDGNVIKAVLMREGKKVLCNYKANEIVMKDFASGNLIFSKKYDKQGRILEFQTTERRFNFEYTKKNTVIIERVLSNKSEKQEVSMARLVQLLEKL